MMDYDQLSSEYVTLYRKKTAGSCGAKDLRDLEAAEHELDRRLAIA